MNVLTSVTPTVALRAVRTFHTLVWALFAGCILALPFAAWRADFQVAAVLIGVVLVEVAILAGNGMRCPLTDIAERFTDDRGANFDIYLPQWLARHNKTIFGWLFVASLIWTAVLWWISL